MRRAGCTIPRIMVRTDAIDPCRTTEAELAALNAFERRMASEARPDDPGAAPEHTLANLRTVSQIDVPLGLVGVDTDITTWVGCDSDGAVVGRARIMTEDRDENRRLAVFGVGVLPQARRKGIGAALLGRVAAEAEVRARTLLLTATSSAVPSGEALMRRIGARRGVVMDAMELSTERVDRKLLDRWIRRSRERAGGFALGRWEGPYPDDALQMAAPLLTETMNAEPRGDLEIEDDSWSPEQLRRIEEVLRDRGLRRTAMYVIETRSDEYAGYTEVYYDERAPQALVQGLTGVAARFRERGLGRWLKAATLERVLERLPEVRAVRTSVAESNHAMLRINRELGFQTKDRTTHWQVRLEDIRSYLGGQEAGGG